MTTKRRPIRGPEIGDLVLLVTVSFMFAIVFGIIG
jgi:hypothetical protein